MQRMWKKKWLALLLVAILASGLAPGFHKGKVYAAGCDPAILGGVEGEGNLKVAVSNGNVSLYRYDGSSWVTQYNMDTCASASAAVLHINGEPFVLGAGTPAWGMYDNKTILSQTTDGRSVTTAWLIETADEVEVQIVQKVSLPSDTSQYVQYEWTIENKNALDELSNLSFSRGVDSNLGGSTEGIGIWFQPLTMIGVEKRVNGVNYLLGMQGVTPPYAYISADKNDYDVAQRVLAGTLINHWDRDSDSDNAYALQWKTDELGGGTSWTITAHEGIIDAKLALSGDNKSTAGEPVTLSYNLTNSSATAYDSIYSIYAPDGWSAVPDKTVGTLEANGGTDVVNVTVTPPEGTAADDYDVDLYVKLTPRNWDSFNYEVPIGGNVTFTASPIPKPPAPTDVTATAGDKQVSLSWTQVDGATGYKVYQSVTSATYGDQIATVTDAVYQATGLTNGTTYYYAVQAFNIAGDSLYSEQVSATPTAGSSTSSGSAPPVVDSGVDVLVNGKPEKAGTLTKSHRNGQSVSTVAIDPKKLADKLAAEGRNTVVTIPVNTQSDVVIGELNGEMVKNMEQSQAVLEIRTGNATYTLPAQQIDIDAISAQIGRSIALQDIKVRIEIAASPAATVQVVQDAAARGSFAIVVPPMDFKVSAAYGDTVVDVERFNAYVERTIAIPDGVDPNKITTGVVVDPDGTSRHVPTRVVTIDGKYYAKINSLTNSTYSVVWHPLSFSDVANHWAKNAVNEMGSRMVVEGIGPGVYDPDKDITRAEFAAIVVRGLGLKPVKYTALFPDVSAADWYGSAVATANSYHLISGFEDGTFRPNDRITREQAMVILSKAMAITGLQAKLSVKTADATLRSFGDAAEVSSWAQRSIADSVQAGIVSGRSATNLAPKHYMTRAEVATIIQKLLQKSDLI